jgi:hypothetical protein
MTSRWWTESSNRFARPSSPWRGGEAEASTSRWTGQLLQQTGRSRSGTTPVPPSNPNPSTGISQDNNFHCMRGQHHTEQPFHSPCLREPWQDTLIRAGFLIKTEALRESWKQGAILSHLAAQRLWISVSWEVRGRWSRKLVTVPNCLWKTSFTGRELRYLMLLTSRKTQRPSNSGDLKSQIPESPGTCSHSFPLGICHPE